MDNILSIISIYFFVAIGYIAKMVLKDEFSEKSIVKLNIYFLLPILSFWGLLTKKIDFEVVTIPFIYIFITLVALFFSTLIARKFFKDPKEISIISMASVTGVTGSIGIPLGLALFSKHSIIYTSLINTISMFFVYTVGVYIYSRGSFSIKKSILNVLKMPIIWASVIAIILNILNIKINPSFFKTLEMGSFGAIVMQLIIFGAFLYDSKIKELNLKLTSALLSIKFFLIPLIAIVFLNILDLDSISLKSILLELIVPIAITNVSLASIFNCKPKIVTSLVFLTSLIFIPYLILFSYFGLI